MQIQETGEIGSTKRKFHLSGVPLIESRLYIHITREAGITISNRESKWKR